MVFLSCGFILGDMEIQFPEITLTDKKSTKTHKKSTKSEMKNPQKLSLIFGGFSVYIFCGFFVAVNLLPHQAKIWSDQQPTG